MIRRIFRYDLAVLLLALWAGASPAVQAQVFPSAHDLVQWTAQAHPAQAPPGTVLQLQLQAQIAEGWKMYALDSPAGKPVSVRFEAADGAITPTGTVRQEEPKEGFDPNFGQDVRYFEHQARFEADLRVAEDAASGAHTVQGAVTFMVCNDRMCLPPTQAPFSETVTVTAEAPPASAPAGNTGREASEEAASGAAASDGAASDGAASDGAASDEVVVEEVVPEGGVPEAEPEAEPSEAVHEAPAEPEPASGRSAVVPDDLAAARAGGLWRFLLLAVAAGLAALLTPCVFPMIPLTVSYFTKHADRRHTAFKMAGVYGLAIILTFTGLGVLMALLLGAAGAQTIAANPWVNLFIGVVFVVFALSLLGLFELRLPTGLLNYFNRQSGEHGGYLGVLFMGLTLTLVSFSCTAPFVGGLLAATVQGTWTYPVLGMLAFSTTFALPFMLFALFPKGLYALPRSGAWMNVVKVVLGFVELAAALKFLSNADLIWGWDVFSRPLVIALVVVIFFMAGLYLLGKLRLAHEPFVETIGVGRLLCAIFFLGLSLYMMPGLLGAPLGALDAYLPPRQATDVSLLAAFGQGASPAQREEAQDWHVDDIEAAFAQARREAKPVFVDFTGYTCTNCREMEANVFPRPEVAQRFARDFVLLRLYTDGLEQGEAFQRYQLQTTGTVALPTYAIVSPQGQLLERVTGLTPADEFVAFLDRGAEAFFQGSLALR